MNNKSIDEAIHKQLEELGEFENVVITMAVVTKQLVEEVLKRHKDLNIGFIDVNERTAWRKLRDSAGDLDHIAFRSEHCNYNKFKQSVSLLKFLILELISRCDDSNMRLWQFHNLLKTYKIVYPAIAPTIEDEQEAFANLFGQSDN